MFLIINILDTDIPHRFLFEGNHEDLIQSHFPPPVSLFCGQGLKYPYSLDHFCLPFLLADIAVRYEAIHTSNKRQCFGMAPTQQTYF